MSYNTRDLYEAVNYPWKVERQNYHDSIECGLGFDDLCVITKEEWTFFGLKVSSLDFSHSLVGFPYEDHVELTSYFFHLLSRQESSFFSLASSNFKIVQGMFMCFNSFKRTETITIIKNPDSCRTFIGDVDNFTGFATTEDWQQTRLSSALRFFRGSQPLTNVLFDTKQIKSLQPVVFEKPSLTLHDFVQIIEEHPRGEEMEYSLCNGMVMCLEFDEIMDLLELYMKKVPRILPYLCSIFCDKSKFIYKLVPTICKYLAIFPDELSLTNKLARHLLSQSDIPNAIRYMPLIESSAWANPECAVTCAYFCHLTGRSYDSLAYLCIADTLITKQEDDFHSLPINVTTPTSSRRFGPTSSEKIILLHFETKVRHMFDVVSNLLAKTEEIRKTTSTFTLISNAGAQTPTRTEKIGCVSSDMKDMHLYDPGLGSECLHVPSLFKHSVTPKIVDALVRQQRLKSFFHQGAEVVFKKKRSVSLLIMAIGIESKRYLSLVYKKLAEKGELSGCEYLLLLKAASIKLIPAVSSLFDARLSNPSQRENNAIVFSKALLKGIQKLEQLPCKV